MIDKRTGISNLQITQRRGETGETLMATKCGKTAVIAWTDNYGRKYDCLDSAIAFDFQSTLAEKITATDRKRMLKAVIQFPKE